MKIPVLCLVLIACTFSACKRKPASDSPVLHTAYFSVIDDRTGKPLNLTINNGSIVTSVEMPLGGPYRFTWVSSGGDVCKPSISASGNSEVPIPDSVITSVGSFHAVGGAPEPKWIMASELWKDWPSPEKSAE